MINLFEQYRRAVMHKANPTRKEAKDKFIAEMRANPDALEALASDYFERQANLYWQSETNGSRVFERTSYVHSQVKRAEAKERSDNALAAMKKRILGAVLMDLELPNGKPLRLATGAECAKAGGFYSEVAKHLKPTQVVDKHLTEADLQNLKKRVYQRNSAS